MKTPDKEPRIPNMVISSVPTVPRAKKSNVPKTEARRELEWLARELGVEVVRTMTAGEGPDGWGGGQQVDRADTHIWGEVSQKLSVMRKKAEAYDEMVTQLRAIGEALGEKLHPFVGPMLSSLLYGRQSYPFPFRRPGF